MPKSKFYISIDVGGTNCRVSLAELQSKKITLHSIKKFPIHRNFDLGVADIALHVLELSHGKKIVGIGASFPGSVNSKKGIIVSSSNLSEWDRKPIKERLQKLTGIPTCIFNDVEAAAAGEALYGLGVNVEKFVFLIRGTGFGGAKVEKIQKKLHITQFEPGHYISDRNGEKCSCGQNGCPEASIGGGPLSKRLKKNLAEISNEDPLWKETVPIAGQAVANTVAFHPVPVIVFGGGLILHRPFLLDEIEKYLAKNLFVFDRPMLKISQLGDNAALYGTIGLQEIQLI